MPTYALGHVAAAATEIQAKDLTIIGHTKVTDASPSAPHITTLLPAIDRERNDAISVSEAITIDGKDLSVGLWYLKEDSTAATIYDFAKLPGGSDGTAQNTARIFDAIGDVDNESFADGEVIMTRSEGDGAVSWIFELGATEGDYELADAVSGYFNKLRNQTQSIVLEPDGGTDEVVSFSQQDDNFGDFVNDLDPTAKFYYVKRNADSTATQSFESGVTTVIPADDFDWYFFRRINDTTVEFMGKPFSNPEVYGTVASKEIGTLKQVPNVKEDGTPKANQDYVDTGLLPLVDGYRLTDGATSNPKFALMFPTFVDGDDLLVPNTFSGDFVRNLGGNAAGFMAFQDHALQDHDHRVKTNSNNSGATASTNNARAGWNGVVWNSSPGVGTDGFEPGANVADETRPANFAMQFCLVLDSYAKVLIVDTEAVGVDASGVSDGDNAIFKDDGAGGLKLAKGDATGLRQPPTASITSLKAVAATDGMHQTVLAGLNGSRSEYVFNLGRTPVGSDIADDAATGAWVKLEVLGTVASNEIGTLKQVPNVKEDGSAKVNQDYVDAGLLPLVNGYTLANGAVDNPKFSLMFPTFVSGDDLTVPNTFGGDFVRNLGGNASTFMASQSDATSANGLRLRTRSTAGGNGFNQTISAFTNTATNGQQGSVILQGDAETRPENFAMQFCLVLDSYSKVLMVDTALAPTDFTEIGTSLNAGSERIYTLQWDGSKIVNTLAKEKWTTGNNQYIIDHLTGHMTIIGEANITSSGTVSWAQAFADTGYTFAHDLREAQSETAAMRINSRTASSITYTLFDSTGTGDGGSQINYTITGRIA